MKTTLPILFTFLSISVFGQSFWSEDFSDGFPITWGTTDRSSQNVLWRHTNVFNDSLSGEHFQSETAENGFLIVKPILNNTPFQSTLTTGFIDCSDKGEVFLEFQTFVQTWVVSAARGYKLYVKNEQENWKSYDILPEQIRDSTSQLSHNVEKVTFDISLMAAGFSEVEIRWEWSGVAEENLALDDVHLFDYEPFYEKVVWGKFDGQGDFDGGLNDWFVRAITPANHPDFRWKWDTFGMITNALVSESLEEISNFPYINSYSNHNGAMIMNPDFFTTGGTTAVTNYPKYECELISPLIDLSGVGNEVNLRFEQMIMLGGNVPDNYPSVTTYSYSLDGGRTWVLPIPLNENLPFNKLVQNTQTISLQGLAGNPSSIKLKFTFSGNLYFWVIDDVVIVEKDEHDLRVKSNFYSIAPNFKTPISQIEPIWFLADVENFGSNVQENVWLHAEVHDENTEQIVFHDSLFYGKIEPGELVENVLFDTFFMPPAQIADYDVRYFLKYDEIDDTPNDNEVSYKFKISEEIYAKEDGGTVRIEPTRRPGSTSADFEYGNCFYLPNGNGHSIDSITFGIANTDDLEGVSVDVVVYKFYPGNETFSFVNEDEYQVVGLNQYQFVGNEEVISGGIITVPITGAGQSGRVETEDGVYYIATVKYVNSLGIACQMLASQDFDYTASWFVHDSLSTPRYASVEKVTLGRFGFENLGFKIIPLVRIHVNKLVSSNQSLQYLKFQVSPNPASDYFEIDNLPNTPIDLKLCNVKGQIVRNWKLYSGSRFSTQGIAKGIYFIKIRTEEGIGISKLILN